MDWSKGYSASYYMTRVDPLTWRDTEPIRMKGGKISRSPSGLMQSADLECTDYGRGREDYVRVYLDPVQGGQHAHVPLFTGLATSPELDISGRIKTNTIKCYSVLKAVDDVRLMRGWYAPVGMPGGLIIKELLGVTPAPVTIADGSPELTEAIIAEGGETNLTMIQRILTAIGWRIRIDGYGAISVEPSAVFPVTMYDPVGADVIETEVKVSEDWYGCPNVFMAISDDVTAIAKDESEKSPLSTVRRGREVWAMESDSNISSTEPIGAYAERRLHELQRVKKTAEYDRRYIPAVMPGDLVMIHYPEQDIDDVYTVESQTIDLSHAARTSEKVSTYSTMADYIDDEVEIGLIGIITDDDDYLVTDTGDRFVAFTDY